MTSQQTLQPTHQSEGSRDPGSASSRRAILISDEGDFAIITRPAVYIPSTHRHPPSTTSQPQLGRPSNTRRVALWESAPENKQHLPSAAIPSYLEPEGKQISRAPVAERSSKGATTGPDAGDDDGVQNQREKMRTRGSTTAESSTQAVAGRKRDPDSASSGDEAPRMRKKLLSIVKGDEKEKGKGKGKGKAKEKAKDRGRK
ncbi:hypothetical protein IAT38_003153 [Cryptococcus sp. DSM 104549]